LEFLAGSIREEEEIKGMQVSKEEVNLPHSQTKILFKKKLQNCS
jgi:hypothetical protein